MKAEDLRALALDIDAGRVFGSWQMNDPDLMPVVFMPLALMDAEAHARMVDIAHIYEYLGKATGVGVNGMPTFTSFHGIRRADWEKLRPMLTQLAAQREAYLHG